MHLRDARRYSTWNRGITERVPANLKLASNFRTGR